MSEKPNIFKAWIFFFLIATLGGAFVGGFGGGIAGLIIALQGGNIQKYTILIKAIAFILALPISFLSYKWTVEKFILKVVS